jgi:hypothetical protein
MFNNEKCLKNISERTQKDPIASRERYFQLKARITMPNSRRKTVRASRGKRREREVKQLKLEGNSVRM